MKKALQIIGILAVLLVIFWRSFLFIVDETQVGIILQLGKPVGGVKAPGLHMKLPLVQNVVLYDNRLLLYDAAPREVITKDKKNLVMDNFARWRISDPLLFYQTVRDERRAQARLDDIVYSLLRENIGRYDLIEIVSSERSEIMAKVTVAANEGAAEYGISIVDVRLKRADLPDENAKHVYDRMRAERERQATKYRAEGEEESKKLRSAADKERAIILAEAYKTAEDLRGQGDAEATRIYAEAFGKDPEFYSFVRSLSVYTSSLGEKDVVILDPDDPLFIYLKSDKAPK
ncbi:MAG: protease modulator HflC [Deltaproteobacteria bacterium]|nr:MAG: protease modulator HflC [Deltaproteobacteria bacterium]